MSQQQRESGFLCEAASTDLANSSSRSSVVALYLIALVATAIVLPMIFLGNASGHDFQPHVASWMEAAAQWREGIIFPRWAAGANAGFGEPRFIFYPPASWMLGGVLGSILPWRMAPGAFVWISIFVAGLSMWKLAREWLSPFHAMVAALIFAANPYHLALVYYRSDFAELLASAFFPLMLCGAFGIFRDGWRRVPLLAIAFAAIWLSNAPAAVVATYSLALILVAGCVICRRLRPLVYGGVGMIGGFGLAAFYLLPGWFEQRWVQIGNAVATAYDPLRNFLFTRLNDPDYNLFNHKISALAVCVILLTIVSGALSFRQRRESPPAWWLLAILAAAAIFLMLPLSALLWRHLPQLKFLQFPWRWLLPLNLAFAFLAATVRVKRQWVWWLTLSCAIFATGVTISGDVNWDSEDVPQLVADIRAGHGYDGIEGFQPRAANADELDDELPQVAEVDPESGDIGPPESIQINVQQWSAERKVFDVKSHEDSALALKLLNYPAWEARVDGRGVSAATVRQTGQLLLPVEAGAHHVEVVFRRTPDRTVGGLISLLFGLGLLAATILTASRNWRRKTIPRLIARPPSTQRIGNSSTT